MPPDEETPNETQTPPADGQQAAAPAPTPDAVAVAGQDEHGEETTDWVLPDEETPPADGTAQPPAGQEPATPLTIWEMLATPEGQQAVGVLTQLQEGQRQEAEAVEARQREITELATQARSEDPEIANAAKTKIADMQLAEMERGTQIEGLSQEAETAFWTNIWQGLFTREGMPKLTETELTGLLQPGEMTSSDYLWHVIDVLGQARARDLGGEAATKREADAAAANENLGDKHRGQVLENGQKVQQRRPGQAPGPATPVTGGQTVPIEPGQKINMDAQFAAVAEHLRSGSKS